MKTSIAIPYTLDNKATDNKAKIWAVGTLLSAVTGLFIGVWAILPIGILGSFIIYRLLDKPHGTLTIQQFAKDENVALLKDVTTRHLEEKGIDDYTFSWHYVYTPISDGETVHGKAFLPHTELKLSCTFANGQIVHFLERLSPWQEIPKTWNYHPYDGKDVGEVDSFWGKLWYQLRLKELWDGLLAWRDSLLRQLNNYAQWQALEEFFQKCLMWLLELAQKMEDQVRLLRHQMGV